VSDGEAFETLTMSSSTARLCCLIRSRQSVSDRTRTHERRAITPEPLMSMETLLIRPDAPRIGVQTNAVSSTYLRRDARTARIVYKALAIRRSFGLQAARVFLMSMGVTASLVHRIVSSPVERLRR